MLRMAKMIAVTTVMRLDAKKTLALMASGCASLTRSAFPMTKSVTRSKIAMTTQMNPSIAAKMSALGLRTMVVPIPVSTLKSPSSASAIQVTS